jgi:hypothetical protein
MARSMRKDAFMRVLFVCLAMLTVGCQTEPEGLYCVDNRVTNCTGNVHLPGCNALPVRDCNVAGGACVKRGGDAECVLERTCPENADSFCDQGMLVGCWHGRVIAGERTPCHDDELCSEVVVETGMSQASCVPVDGPCSDGETRCEGLGHYVECSSGRWQYTSACPIGMLCAEASGYCTPWPIGDAGL